MVANKREREGLSQTGAVGMPASTHSFSPHWNMDHDGIGTIHFK